MNVNSYVLFGEKREHWAGGFATNLRQHFTLYPDWTLWIHTDKELDNKGYCGVLRKLAQEGIIKVNVVPETRQTHHQRWKCMMMLWRLLPIWHNTNYVFCRDLDSILTPRQLQCVRSFLSSQESAHGINDNVSHDIALMGGMCGFKCSAFRQLGPLEALVNGKYSTEQWNAHGTDQSFLMRYIWPHFQNRAMIHRLEGPNERYHLKKVTSADISDIPEQIRNRGDDFTNYIGAVGCNGDAKDIIEFYNTYGNQKICNIISKIEKEYQ